MNNNFEFLRAAGEYDYSNLLRHARFNGEERFDRTGVGTNAVFGVSWEADISNQFPLFVRKSMPWKQTIDELKWFISGGTNYKQLPERTQHWWSSWADDDGELGPIYGKQFRDGNGVDQLAQFLDGIVLNPFSRRHVISLWDPKEMNEAKLPCCHGLVIQAYVSNDDELSLQMYQRSADLFIGVPVNIASYALFTYLVAAATRTRPKRLRIVFGDAHVYRSHREQVDEYLARQWRPAPSLKIDDRLSGLGIEALESFTEDDLELIDYHPDSSIKAPLAV